MSAPGPASRPMSFGKAVVAGGIVVGGVVAAMSGWVTSSVASAPTRRAAATSPIHHVVVIFQENHSFDNVLGRFCRNVATGAIVRAGLNMGCSYALSGKTSTGSTVVLSTATDLIPDVAHEPKDQRQAVDGGRMDRFDLLKGCEPSTGYACYSAFSPGQVPALATMAQNFALSDATFQSWFAASWVSHLALVASTPDGFTGVNPPDGDVPGPGWGCDSGKDAKWGQPATFVPSCVPDYTLDPVRYPYGGAYRSTPVAHVPTVMDEMDAAGVSWKLYADLGYGQTGPGYKWAVCPTFAECLDHTSNGQAAKWVASQDAITDATNGTLPTVSFVMPNAVNSQHNLYSMRQGDRWIGGVVSAIASGPQWASSAVFITYDDCGCFYDHVAPPRGMGPRMPMVIVSPYAKAGYTDSTVTSFDGILAFIEHAFGLPALTPRDAVAYDYAKSFDFTQRPIGPNGVMRIKISPAERVRWSGGATPDD
jgi:phospholipase C